MSAEDSINVKSSIEKQFKERPKELISKLKEYEKDIFNKLPNHLRKAAHGNQQVSGLTYADYVREKNHFYDNKLTGE